jgi:hypothetical protein
VVVPGFANKLVTVLAPMLPRRWILKMADGRNRDRG